MKKVNNSRILSFRESVSVFIWSIKLVFSLGGTENYLYVIASILSGLIPNAVAYVNGLLLDSLTKLYGSNLSILDIIKPNVIDTIDLLIITGLLTLLNNIISIYSDYLERKFNDFYAYLLEDRVAAEIINLDLSNFDNHDTASVVVKARRSIYQVRNVFGKFINLSTYIVTFITSGYFIFNMSPWLGIFVILVSLPKTIVYNKYVKLWWHYRNSNFEDIKIRDNLHHTMTTPMNITQIRVQNHKNSLMTYLHSLSSKIGEKGFLNVRKWKSKFDSLMSVFDMARVIGIPAFLLPNLLKGTATVGSTYFVLDRAGAFASTVRLFFGELTELFDQLVGAADLKQLFELKSNIVSGKLQFKVNKVKIEFKNVCFKYPETKRDIFKNLSLIIAPGEEIAIVGVNGAGKSTFIKLLLRIYDPDKGEILLNDINIKEYDLKSYYSKIAVLLQEYKLYHFLNIAENIAIGEKLNMNQVKTAIKKAEAEGVIASSPLGYKQKMDRIYKDGMLYSSGQKQKLAIARLLYRNAPLVILDEPTASIDPVSEYNIFKRIYQHMTNKTVIIISHRFSTVRNAKKIYVFDKGKIIEEGSHSELININGIYADAFNKQAEGYTK